MAVDSVTEIEPRKTECPAREKGGRLRWLRARLAARPDSEHEMSANRFAFLALMAIYLWVDPVAQQRWALIALGLGFVLTLGIFAHIVWRPAANNFRRSVAFCADLGTICLM